MQNFAKTQAAYKSGTEDEEEVKFMPNHKMLAHITAPERHFCFDVEHFKRLASFTFLKDQTPSYTSESRNED